MNLAQHQVFPFFNYYPLLFCPPWNNSFPIQPQKPSNQPNTNQGSVSLIRSFQSSPTLDQIKPKSHTKTLSQAANKPNQKSKLKKKKEREDDYSRKHQKKDRNLPSNIFKIFSNFIYSNSRLTNYLRERCLGQFDVDPAQVLQKFKTTIKSTQSYIRPAAIQPLCREGLMTPGESLAFRILVKKFLLEEFPVIITQQPKLKKSQKVAYLKLSRTLQRQLSEGFFQ